MADLGRCAVPECRGGFAWSNIHRDPATCAMNPEGSPTGCDEPGDHHPFQVSYETAERMAREESFVLHRFVPLGSGEWSEQCSYGFPEHRCMWPRGQHR